MNFTACKQTFAATMKQFASVLFACLLSVAFVTCHPDEVLNLPGLTFIPNFAHYSGYLNASSGKYLHYWFVESEEDPANDPLVLWLNGGPGCSSLHGLLAEHGPFHVMKDGKTLYENPHRWNKVANVIYLEAPAGVGFSYADDHQYATNDIITAEDNYLALQHFFVKFPQFKKNDFYITGESYGGVFVPTLSVLVLNGSADINFKGFAIGNGMLDTKKFEDSIIFFAYYHGLFGQTTLNNITSKCCKDAIFSPSTCEFSDSNSLSCIRIFASLLRHIIQKSGINVYNIYAECTPHESDSSDQSGRKLLTRSFTHSNHVNLPCTDTRNVFSWINQPEVRTALHISPNLPEWTLCSVPVRSSYSRTYHSMKSQVLTLMQSRKVRGLIYNGDIDMTCNFLGNQWFVDELQLELKSAYREWKFENQVGGFIKEFNRLAFVTIKGSGHMVPQDKPGPALEMITNFLYQRPFL